ncbi:MAG: TraB/GumN family protein [Polyangiaceae bacterium]
MKNLPRLILFTLLWVLGCQSAEPQRARAAIQTSPATSVAVGQPQTSAVPASEVAPSPSADGSESASQPIATKGKSSWSRLFLYRFISDAAPFYVFGTIHLPDSRLDAFPEALDRALEASQRVSTEIPMDEAAQMAIVPMLMLPKGQRLGAILPKPLHAKLSNAFEEKGLPFAPFEQLKPWAITMQVAVLNRIVELAVKKPIDAVIYQRAKAEKKEVSGLETAREQLEMFDTLSQSEQVELLENALEFRAQAQAKQRDVLDELLDAYLRGDERAIERLMHEEYEAESPLSRKIMKRVFTDRNQSLTERILKQVRHVPKKVQLFAIGCGHVVGTDGIVERLRQQGFSAERLGS